MPTLSLLAFGFRVVSRVSNLCCFTGCVAACEPPTDTSQVPAAPYASGTRLEALQEEVSVTHCKRDNDGTWGLFSGSLRHAVSKTHPHPGSSSTPDPVTCPLSSPGRTVFGRSQTHDPFPHQGESAGAVASHSPRARAPWMLGLVQAPEPYKVTCGRVPTSALHATGNNTFTITNKQQYFKTSSLALRIPFFLCGF